jgi:hypothetical protein
VVLTALADSTNEGIGTLVISAFFAVMCWVGLRHDNRGGAAAMALMTVAGCVLAVVCFDGHVLHGL